ncbi:MAG: hypothetical protein K2H34_10560, partial [Lachnospiraceae bacterium]|nr:hypothetical protein [Lachnospiraceae bacterium]
NGSNATPSQQTKSVKEDEIRYQLIKGRTKKYIIYDWVTIADNCEVSLVKEGKNVLTAYDLHGNTTSVTYYVDSKAPIIKGVKNKKTYRKQAILYVKDKQKLAKVTVNNKKQKLSRKNLVKKGKYKGYYKIKVSQKGSNYITAYDQAGNKKNITINIVK